MRISTATSVYVNYSIEEAIRHASVAGYDGVDIWGGRPHVYRRDFSPRQLKALRALLDGEGLSVPSFMPAFFRYPHSLTNPNPVVRQDTLDYMRACADNAAALGASLLLIVPGRSLHGQPKDDAWQRLADGVNTICEEAASHPLRLAVEPVNGWVSDLVNTAADALRIVEQVGCERLGVALDTGHIHLSDEPPQVAVELAGDRLFQVHVNDNDGQHQQNLVPGDGSFDFAGFVEALRGAGYAGFITAELGWHYTLDPDPAVRLAAERMRAML